MVKGHNLQSNSKKLVHKNLEARNVQGVLITSTVSVAGTSVLNKAFGLEGHFSWRYVLVQSSVSLPNARYDKSGEKVNGKEVLSFSEKLFNNALNTTSTLSANRVFNHSGTQQYGMIAVNSFGQTLVQDCVGEVFSGSVNLETKSELKNSGIFNEHKIIADKASAE